LSRHRRPVDYHPCATGSIGASTVDLIKREPERYRVNRSARAAMLLRWEKSPAK
jgi:hypothetical protein